MIRRGDKITVRDLRDNVWRATVRLVAGGRITWERATVRLAASGPITWETGAHIDTCATADEGRVWAKGWDTPAANALRTVVVLSRSTT